MVSVNKAKALQYLRTLGPLPSTTEIKELLNSAAKIIQNFDSTKSFGKKNENSLENSKNPARFSVANNNQAIFVSNAAQAVEKIKQEKATPAQWLFDKTFFCISQKLALSLRRKDVWRK